MIAISDIERLKSREDVEKFLGDRYQADPARFIFDINSTINNLLQTDLSEARRLIDSLKPCFKHLPEFHRPRLIAIEARFAHWSGRTRMAMNRYRKAIDRLKEVRNHEAVARARQGLMDVYMYAGRYEDALEVGRNALKYFRRVGNDFNAARVMTNIGNVYHRLDRNHQALKYYEQAREIFSKSGGVPLAILDFNRANIYTNLNRLDPAESLYRSAADLFRENNMALAVNKAEYSLAYLYFLADKYTQALTTFERVLEAFEKTGDKRSVAVTQLDLAEINTQLNQFGSAIMLGQQALANCRKNRLHYEQGKAAYFVAQAFRRLGDQNRAAQYLNQAEKLFVKEANQLWRGIVMLERSRLKMAGHRYDQAMAMAIEAERYFKISGDKRRGLDARITLMEIHLGAGRIEEALKLGEKLISARPVSYQEHIIHNLMGLCFNRLSMTEKALSSFNRAIEIIEKMLVNIYPDEIRFFFALDKYPTYLAAVNCLLELNRVEDSFLQHSHALAVLNQKCVSGAILGKEVPSDLLKARAGLRASLKKMTRLPDSAERRVASPATMYNDEHRLWDTERKIRSFIYPDNTVRRLPRFGSDNYIEALKADESLISYMPGDRNIGAFCTCRGRTKYTVCQVNFSQLETTVRELHFLMEKSVYTAGGAGVPGEIVEHYLKRLFEWLIEPLDLPDDSRNLIFVLDGLFAQIPFMALIDPRRGRLKDRYPILIIVNPQDLIDRRRQEGFSDRYNSAVFAPGNVGLPMIEAEGNEIKRLFPSARYYSGTKASIGQLKKELGRVVGFVHIATHASRSSENPLFSRILMEDGPFFPFDLFGTGIKARLVSLSGCQTAAPGIYYGNSFSLAKAFYQGGADRVMASLWPISDKISLVFMTEFYRALKSEGNITDAYRTAVDKTCAVNDNPAFWGPFVLLGL